MLVYPVRKQKYIHINTVLCLSASVFISVYPFASAVYIQKSSKVNIIPTTIFVEV